MARVIALVHETDGIFGLSFPDFPGCTTVANGIDLLFAKASSVLTFHAKGMIEDGLALPRIRSLNALWGDPVFLEDKADAVLVTYVDLDVDGNFEFVLENHAVTVDVSVPETILMSIDQAARRAGQTRSKFLLEAALMRLDRQSPI